MFLDALFPNFCAQDNDRETGLMIDIDHQDSLLKSGQVRRQVKGQRSLPTPPLKLMIETFFIGMAFKAAFPK